MVCAGKMLTQCRFDPAGFILEHYVDGDLLDMSEPIHKNPASPDNLHVWGESTYFVSPGNVLETDELLGPDLPPTFLT